MNWQYNDGGRAAAGYRGTCGDCVARAVAIASGLPYAQVYAALADGTGSERKSKGATARNGIHTSRDWFKSYMRSIGFRWVATMGIGTGCTVHLNANELPPGRLVVSVSKHYTAVIDGVIHDTHNPSERGVTIYPAGSLANIPANARRLESGDYVYEPERCVYGYWIFEKQD